MTRWSKRNTIESSEIYINKIIISGYGFPKAFKQQWNSKVNLLIRSAQHRTRSIPDMGDQMAPVALLRQNVLSFPKKVRTNNNLSPWYCWICSTAGGFSRWIRCQMKLGSLCSSRFWRWRWWFRRREILAFAFIPQPFLSNVKRFQ